MNVNLCYPIDTDLNDVALPLNIASAQSIVATENDACTMGATQTPAKNGWKIH